MKEHFHLLSRARQNMFIGNNQRQWEDDYNTKKISIRKLKKPQNTPKKPNSETY